MLTEKTYSDSYKQLILALHEGPEYGKRTGPYVYQLENGGQAAIVNKIVPLNPATVLDYGCGSIGNGAPANGTIVGNNLDHLKHFLPAVTITNYDPFVTAFNTFPTGTFDVVVANDVLNDVEGEYLDAVVTNLYELSNNYVVLSIVVVPYRVTEEYYMNLINAKFDVKFAYTTPGFTTNEGDQATRKVLVLQKKA